MKINTLFNQKKTVFSLEIFPPKKTGQFSNINEMLREFAKINPDFISVTYGAGASNTNDLTWQIAAQIKALNIEPLAHFTCVNSNIQQIKQNIKQLNAAGIENVLALRGDINTDIEIEREFKHASDLVKLIKQNSSLNIVGACYPEGHYENKTLNDDIENLKYKLDAGVTHLITQLFFDNNLFYNFINQCRKSGITVPIQAGIMPIVTTRQIERTVALSGASLPPKFTKMINKYSANDEALFKAGINYAADQILDLLQSGVDGIHLYTMNNPKVAFAIYDKIKTKL